MKKCNIIFNILTVIAYFYGILLCATLILIPVGVYAVISAHRYSDFANYTPFQLSQNKKKIKNWITFGCVLYFPLGLIGLLCLPQINNNIVVEDTEPQPAQTTQEQSTTQQTEPEKTVEVEIHTPETEAEKNEKLAKLERFKQNGLITEAEFEQAKAELYNNQNK